MQEESLIMATNELAETSNVQSTPMGLLQTAVQSGADPAQLEKLLALQERWERNEALKKFNYALAAFQKDCPIIHKSRQARFGNGGYNFASLDDIMRKIQPLLTMHGLSVTFSSGLDKENKNMRAECRVHCDLHVETTEIDLPLPEGMKVNDTQKAGAAFSYAKRYALCAALNITVSDEDDDAGGMGETISEEQAIRLREIAESIDNATAKRFLKWLGVTDYSQVPLAKYEMALSKLAQKQRTQ